MNLTYFSPRKRGNVENNNNSPLNIRFSAKTSDIRNFSQNIWCDVKTSEVATLVKMTSKVTSSERALFLAVWSSTWLVLRKHINNDLIMGENDEFLRRMT